MKPSAVRVAATLSLFILLTALSGCASVTRFRQHLGYRQWQECLKTALPSSHQTDHFDIFYRPASKSAVHAKRIGAAAETELTRICSRLEVPNDVRYTLFLFDDGEDLAKTTKVQGSGGFSFEKLSCLIYGDAPARTHEMVHLVTHQKIPGGPMNMFRVEGLANAVLDSFGYDMHAVAKRYRDTGQLPRLQEMMDSPGYEWLKQHPNLNTYDIAGSWMKFLLETQGAEKTKRYYARPSAGEAFGATLESLEKDWLAALDRYRPTEETARHVELSNGRSTERYTVVEGESFSGHINFNLIQGPKINADGTWGVAFGGKFTTGKTAAPPDEAPKIKYAWLKNGVRMENLRTPSLELSNVTLTDAGTYVGVVAYKEGEAEPMVLTAWVVLLTVVPKSELSLP